MGHLNIVEFKYLCCNIFYCVSEQKPITNIASAYLSIELVTKGTRITNFKGLSIIVYMIYRLDAFINAKKVLRS